MNDPQTWPVEELVAALEAQSAMIHRAAELIDEAVDAFEAGDVVGWRAARAEADLLRAGGVLSSVVADEARRRRDC